MKTQTPFNEIADLEKELDELAPLVRQGFRQAGGPSPRIEDAIRAEARRCAGKKQNRFAWPVYRTLAAVAAFALLLGGSVQLHLSLQDNLKDKDANRSAAAEKALPAPSSESTPGLANLLLEIQGLNEEGFFRTEEAEPLWL